MFANVGKRAIRWRFANVGRIRIANVGFYIISLTGYGVSLIAQSMATASILIVIGYLHGRASSIADFISAFVSLIASETAAFVPASAPAFAPS